MRSAITKLFFCIGILTLFIFPFERAQAQELAITCGEDLLNNVVKETYPSCETAGSALPGDALALKGSGFISGTKNSPVNIEQWAVFSGNGTSVKSRIYSFEPSFPKYSTQYGAFIANTIAPLELQAGVYTVSFKVRRYSCNRLTGKGPCAIETASAQVRIKPTADKNDVELRCPPETPMSNPISCAQRGRFRVLANQLRAQKGKTIFVYAKQGNKYTSLGSPVATKNHSIKFDGELENLNPGSYSLIVRENDIQLKNRGWELQGVDFQIEKLVEVETRREGDTIGAPQQPPVEFARVMIESATAPSTFFNAPNAPTIPKKFPDSLVSGQQFDFKVKWTGVGKKFKDPHFISVVLGKYEGMTFKEFANFGKLEVTSWKQRKTLDPVKFAYSFQKNLPSELTEGYYILKITSDDYPDKDGSYMTQRPVYIEQVSKANAVLIAPRVITPNQTFELSGTGFPSFSKITSIAFQGDEIAVLPVDISVNQDGVFHSRITAPQNTDKLIKNIYDEQGNYVEQFYWREGATGRLNIHATVREENGHTFTVSTQTLISILCVSQGEPNISISPQILAQAAKFFFTVVARGFTCRDSLKVNYEGIRVNGKDFSIQEAENFFSVNASTLKTDTAGEASILVLNHIEGQKALDADVSRIRLIVTDFHGRGASAEMNILPKYTLQLKTGIGQDYDRITALWKGFAVPGSRATLSLENPALLGSRNPIILKSLYLTYDDKDSDNNPFIEFSLPSQLPFGDYTLRLKQGDIFAITQIKVSEPEKPAVSAAPSVQGAKKPIAAVNPCKNLEGFMLRQCRIAYGIQDPKDSTPEQIISEQPIPSTGEKTDSIGKEKCAELSGYMLKQCEATYSISPLPSTEQKNAPTNGVQCEELKGSALTQCMQPPKQKTETQYCDPIMPTYSQKNCIERPTQQTPSGAGQYCNLGIPRYAQQGCIEQI